MARTGASLASFSRGRYGRDVYFAPGESPGAKYRDG
jgi:hypothetical protein